MQAFMVREATATCMLAIVAQLMYRSDNFKSGMPKNILWYYLAYLIGSMVIFNITAIIYDHTTGNGENLLSSIGHCEFPDPDGHSLVLAITAFTSLTRPYK